MSPPKVSKALDEEEAKKSGQLFLGNYELIQPPQDLSRLQHLQKLFLMNNRLREISAPILELTNLRLLQLDYNLIESIPPGINELKYLESLLLRHNRLKSIPTHTLRSLPFLQTLWLDHNPLPSGSDVNVGQLQLTKGRSGTESPSARSSLMMETRGRVRTMAIGSRVKNFLDEYDSVVETNSEPEAIVLKTDYITAKLKVDIIGAKGLPKMSNGSCDAFCVLRYLHSIKQKAKPQKYKTKTRKETCDPQWGEIHTFSGHASRLIIDIYHADTFGEHQIGRSVISVNDIAFDEIFTYSVPILHHKMKGKKAKKMKKKAQQGAADEEGDGAVDVVDQAMGVLNIRLQRQKCTIGLTRAASALPEFPGENFIESVPGVQLAYSSSISLPDQNAGDNVVDESLEFISGEILLTTRAMYMAVDNQVTINYAVMVPYGLISKIEDSEDVAYIYCKDMRTLKLKFPPGMICDKVTHLLHCMAFPCDPYGMFAFRRFKALQDPSYNAKKTEATAPGWWKLFNPKIEFFQRQGVPPRLWRASVLNDKYTHSHSYPRYFLVPTAVDNEVLSQTFSFRGQGRIPILSYYHINSATITRSSQPLIGIKGKRNKFDELLVENIRCANMVNPLQLLITDARPFAAAVGNKMVGAGYEEYSECKIEFMDIPNIHAMRSSLHKLWAVCASGVVSATKLEDSLWPQHIRTLLTGAKRIATVVEEHGSSVLVHCSDGWDRTSQLCSLAKIMLDPYYRTIQGFLILLEMDWLSAGHKFAERYGHGNSKHDDSERSPIFLQLFDAIWQLLRQFPDAFEFHENLLLFILDQMYACEYGTFLFNNQRERDEFNLSQTTLSLWGEVLAPETLPRMRNPFYLAEQHSVIFPGCDHEDIHLWAGYYLRWTKDPIATEVDIRLGTAYVPKSNQSLGMAQNMVKRIEELEAEIEELKKTNSQSPTPEKKPETPTFGSFGSSLSGSGSSFSGSSFSGSSFSSFNSTFSLSRGIPSLSSLSLSPSNPVSPDHDDLSEKGKESREEKKGRGEEGKAGVKGEAEVEVVSEENVPVEACCVGIYEGGEFRGLLKSGDEGKFYVEKKESPSEVKDDLSFLFLYHPQIRRMMRLYDIHVIGLKSLKLQKWISRPHHGHTLKTASRMLDCECFKESKRKDYWKIYTNGLDSPLPLYLGGKEGNKLCFGERPIPPSICIRPLDPRMTSLPQTITLDLHQSSANHPSSDKHSEFDWWEKDEGPRRRSAWIRGDRWKAGEGGDKAGAAMFANLKERGGGNSQVKLEEFEIVFGADNRPISPATSTSPATSPATSPVPSRSSSSSSPSPPAFGKDLRTTSILGFYMNNVASDESDDESDGAYDDDSDEEDTIIDQESTKEPKKEEPKEEPKKEPKKEEPKKEEPKKDTNNNFTTSFPSSPLTNSPVVGASRATSPRPSSARSPLFSRNRSLAPTPPSPSSKSPSSSLSSSASALPSMSEGDPRTPESMARHRIQLGKK